MQYYNNLRKMQTAINKIITTLNETNNIIINAICSDFNLKYRDICEKMGISKQYFYFYKKNPNLKFNLKLLNLYFKLCEEHQQSKVNK